MTVLRTFELDADKKICLINGKDVSKTANYVSLTFENGTWSLELQQTHHYCTTSKTTNEIITE